MKQLKHRQNVLDHKIEALEGDMISITKETFEELDYLKRELELTGYNIKVLTTEIKNVQYQLCKALLSVPLVVHTMLCGIGECCERCPWNRPGSYVLSQ